MVFGPPPNCHHLDNWRGCRLESHANWFHRLLGVRPHCLLDRTDQPRDGEWFCADQKPYPRPAPPRTSSGVKARNA